jgi:hypothetical protein
VLGIIKESTSLREPARKDGNSSNEYIEIVVEAPLDLSMASFGLGIRTSRSLAILVHL